MKAYPLTLSEESPSSPDAVLLMEELSACLEAITGDSGASSFDPREGCDERSAFIIARDASGHAVGCGAFRPFDSRTAEIKRVYAREPSSGIGSQILTCLEGMARGRGYEALCLETRRVNERAVSFYRRSGYRVISNYGKYENRPECICFGKSL